MSTPERYPANGPPPWVLSGVKIKLPPIYSPELMQYTADKLKKAGIGFGPDEVPIQQALPKCHCCGTTKDGAPRCYFCGVEF